MYKKVYNNKKYKYTTADMLDFLLDKHKTTKKQIEKEIDDWIKNSPNEQIKQT